MADYSYSTLSDDTLRRLSDGQLFAAEELSTTTCVQCGGTWVHAGDLMCLLMEIREAAVNEVRQEVYTGLIDLLREVKHRAPSQPGD